MQTDSGSGSTAQVISGAAVVTAATVVIATISIIALYHLTGNRVAVATAGFGVISTMVSAYVGVKAGSESGAQVAKAATKDAVAAHARAAAYRLHVPDDEKHAADDAADGAAGAARR